MSDFGKIFNIDTLSDVNFNLRQELLTHKVIVFKKANYDNNAYYNLIKPLLQENNILSVDYEYDYSHLTKLQESKTGQYGYYARWQVDHCWDTEVANICSLNVVEVDDLPTSMIWVDLQKVRDLLDAPTIEFITKQSITGWNILNPKDLYDRQSKAEYKHPALRIHPETKLECVFYSGPSTIGKDNDKWQNYLRYLLEFFQKEENLFMINWEKGDIIIWDNISTSYTFIGSEKARSQKFMILGSKPVWY